MEGNDCYKFSTIRNFIARSQAKDVDTIIEIGANIGEVTLLMHAYRRSRRTFLLSPSSGFEFSHSLDP
jgi:hypothetical protein